MITRRGYIYRSLHVLASPEEDKSDAANTASKEKIAMIQHISADEWYVT